MYVLVLKGTVGPVYRELLAALAAQSTPRWRKHGPSMLTITTLIDGVLVSVDAKTVADDLDEHFTQLPDLCQVKRM